MSASDTAWAEHADAYEIGRASRDAEVADLEAQLAERDERRRAAPTAEEWNAVHPIGTRVRYWPLRPTSTVPPVETKTRSAAWRLGNGPGVAVVLVDGVVGGVFLTHVDVLDAANSCLLRGAVCPEHGCVHGQEAEELRAGIEDMLELSAKHVPARDLRALLDQVDARDSLAFCEAKDGADRG